MDQTQTDWQAWYDRHGPALLLFARQVADSLAEAEDAVHDGFIRFWKRKDAVDDPAAYLYRAVRHAALDRRRGDGRRGDGRRDQRERACAHTDHPQPPQPWQDVARDETDTKLRSAIAGLPEQQREVLVMKVWGGLTFDQIALAIQAPRSTTAARYAASLKSLRSALPAEEYTP